MKWEEDLVKDIRTGNQEFDDRDAIPNELWGWAGGVTEVSACNLQAMRDKFLPMADRCKSILEIGINRNGEGSFTQIFLKNKRPDCKYFGIDIDDKAYLNDEQNNIYTIRNDSSNYDSNMMIMKLHGVEGFDFIFIDGWHSINQMLRDWEYVRHLSPNGIVGFHDVNHHPGPKNFAAAIDRSKWSVELHCPNDFGIGFAWRK